MVIFFFLLHIGMSSPHMQLSELQKEIFVTIDGDFLTAHWDVFTAKLNYRRRSLYNRCMETFFLFSFYCTLGCLHYTTSSSSSWWSLGLEDDIICASYLWVREWLCRPILDLQSRAQSGHWKFAFVAGIQAAKWWRSLADCA